MMKGLLVLFMTLSHLTYCTKYYVTSTAVKYFNIYVNLTSFSGFVFCFGYVCWSAYIVSYRTNIERRILISAGKVLAVYYISGIALTFFQGGTMLDVLRVLLLRYIPSFSEFLFSFFIIYILLLLTRNVLKELSLLKASFLISASFLLTWFPYEVIESALAANIVGTSKYSCFPIAQYSSYFMIGMLLAKKKIIWNKWLFAGSIIANGMFLWQALFADILPKRFPPSIFWIIGGYFIIYVYFLFFNWIAKRNLRLRLLEYLGRHTLVVLLVGNLVMFFLRGITQEEIQNYISTKYDWYKYLIIVISCLGLSVLVSELIIFIKENGFSRFFSERNSTDPCKGGK